MLVPIVLAGHIDTVKPDCEKYNTNPLSLTKIEGKAYGLGSIDMKSFTAVILDEFEFLKGFEKPLVLALTTDEETDLLCIENVIDKMKELSIKPTFTIVGEPTNCEIKTCANGCYEYSAEIFGKSCHSSVIENGINAIIILAKLVSFIENQQKLYSGLSSNPGIISGGDIVNRVPDYAKLNFDIRSTDAGKIQSFIRDIENYLQLLEKEYGATTRLTKLLEIPLLQDKQNPQILNVAKTLNLPIGKFSGGCEAGYFQKYSGDAILFGVGDLNFAHKPNEYVVIEEYNEYKKLLKNLLSELKKK